MRLLATATAAALSLGSIVHAQTAQSCPSTNLCYSLSIPDASASSGSGDIFFQLTAPTTYQWIAMGQGTSMTGANIFIIYTDAAGTNVTLSPRLGTGQVEPKYDSAAQVTLLAGSGVSNGVMTANVKCANCASWSGGTMDFSSSTTNWIWAEKTGDALDSDSTSEDISQHNNMGTMSFSLSEAKSSNDVNPFLSDSTTSGSASGSGASATSAAATTCVSSSATLASPTGSGCPTAWPSSYSTAWPTARPSQYSSCFASYASYYGSSYGNHAHWPTAAPYVKRDTCDDGSSSSGSSSSGTSGSSSNSQGGSSSGGSFSNNGIPFGGDSKKAAAVMMAHGITAALAFVIFFPGGGIIIRLFSFRGLVWVHAAIQALGWLIFLVAFGLGIYLAQQTHQLNHAHPIIGILLFILLCFQPLLGLAHHFLFKKHHRRVFWSYAHIWLGRILITLGIINGGLGLQLADNATQGQEIAYAVIAAVIWLVYVASIVVGEIKRRRTKRDAPPGYEKSYRMGNLSDGGSDEGVVGNGNREFYAKPSRSQRGYQGT